MQHTDKQKVLFLAKQEALEQGFEGAAAEAFVTVFIKNFEKGANEKAVAVAKAMLKHGDDVDYVSLISGLTVDEIKKIG